MIRLVVPILLALSAPLVWAADAAASVKESSAAWRRAVIQQDRETLATLLADDLVYAHSNGKTESKLEYIAAVTSGPSRYEAFTETDTKVRVYGPAAVLEGHIEVKPTGRPSYKVRTLEVYVNQGGKWKMTAHQSARLNP
ncbi:MAG: nuclear transport factor 2 family protein [Bryobacteraceae bacterium]